MNRLIIIGNGFDLAHNRKTSFKDFILDYFSNAVNSFFHNFHFQDELLEFGMQPGFTDFIPKPKPATKNDVIEIIGKINANRKNLIFKFKSPIVEHAYKNITELNWVDLEMSYFKILLATINAHKGKNEKEAIKKLNDQFDFLKKKLIDYLKEDENNFKDLFDKSDLVDCFTEDFNPKEIVLEQVSKNKPKSLYFLNFNYTYTLDEYINQCSKQIHSDINYIHGDLNSFKAQPIFGFGDEKDKKYLEFEEKNNNELFRHIKSFEYHKSQNYFDLIRYLDSEVFQVQIYGHSCGLTDRTMLNHIFEHTNCKSIKIFYYQNGNGKHDFVNKTHEISRHFNDKGLMRKKIVPLNLSREMPQPKIKKY